MLEVHFNGLREIEAALQRLPAQVRRGGVILRGLQKGADLVRQEAKTRAPVLDEHRRFGSGRRKWTGTALRRRGALRSGIVTQKVGGRQLKVLVRVRSRGYIFAENKGWGRAHRLANPALAGNPNYWWLVEFGTSQAPAQPFMRPAFEARKFQALVAVRDAMWAEIKAALANPAAYAGPQGRSRRPVLLKAA